MTHPAQLPGFLAEKGLSLTPETQLRRLLPLIQAQADPRIRDVLADGRAALGRGPKPRPYCSFT